MKRAWRARLGLAAGALAAGALAACASDAPRFPQLPPLPPPPGTPSDELSKSLEFVEYAEDGSPRRIDARRHLADVDYKSRLTIVPDPEKLRELAGSAADVLPPLSPAEQQRLDLLRGVAHLVEELRPLSTALDAMLATVDEARAAGRAPSPEEIAEAQALIRREADVRRQMLEHIEATVRAEVAREMEPGTEAFDVEVATRAQRFLEDERGQPVLLNLRRFQELLEGQIQELERTLARDRARLEADATSLRMRAILHSGGKAVPVHIENYDTIDANWVAKEPRVGFGSREDQQRVQQEVAAIDALLTLRRDAASGELELAELLDRLEQALRADLQRLRGAARELRPRGGGEGLAALVDLAREGASPEETAQLDALAGFLRALERLADAFSALRARPGGPRRQGLPIEELAAALTQVRTFVEEARALDLAGSVRVLGERLSARSAELATSTEATVESVLPEVLAATRAAVEEHRRDLERLALVASAVSARLVAVPVAAAADAIDPRVRPRPLSEVVPGEIDLHGTIADSGDHLEIIAELLHREGETEEIFPSTRRIFAVDRFGIVNTLSADVSFVRQTSDDHFRPAPAAAWTLYYRLPDEPDDTFGRDVWQFFDPGIGLSVHAMSSDAESFQAGVGPHLSFFHDLVRGGWGYNLSADSNRGYVFLSIGMFQAIEGIGTLLTGRFGTTGAGSK